MTITMAKLEGALVGGGGRQVVGVESRNVMSNQFNMIPDGRRQRWRSSMAREGVVRSGYRELTLSDDVDDYDGRARLSFSISAIASENTS